MRTHPNLPALLMGICLGLGCQGAISGSPGLPPDEGVAPAPGQEFRCEAAVADPGPIASRRLTVSEYASTVSATLGVDVAAEATALLPAEIRADGFTNSTGTLIVTLDHVDAFAELAQIAVSRLDVPQFVDRYVDCSDLSEACGRAIVDNIGLRLYRAPVTSDESNALLGVWSAASAESATFEEAAGLLIEAMLQGPRFVYRMERQEGAGATRPVDGYELASRLSYLIWGSAPDEVLLAEAAANRLTTDAEVEAQVRRMLEDPRGREAFARFIGDWLHLSRLDSLTREPEQYPDWTPTIGEAMKTETLAFAEALVWDGARPLLELFNDQRTFVERPLAEYYGFDNPLDGLQLYDLSATPERGGLLTQGSLLAIGGNESSMVARGQFLLENVLCGGVDSPPPGVDTTPPETTAGQSQRSYSEGRVNNPSCGGCHSQMEPLAWGLERFDGTGLFRTEDSFGNTLREDGSMPVLGQNEAVPFSSVGAMMDLLANNDRVRDCISLKTAQFALGRLLLESDGCSLVDMRDRFETTDQSYQELIVAISLSPMIRTIRTQ